MNFYQKMRIVCLAIPEGRVATYGQIALLCGQPNHSRQVGYGLKHCLGGSNVQDWLNTFLQADEAAEEERLK